MERARFKAHLQAFESQLVAEGKSANTLTSYTRDVREFLAFLAAGPYEDVIQVLTEEHIAAFIASLQGRELAQRSKAKKLTSIRSFMLFCRRHGLLQSYPLKLTFTKLKPRVAEILARHAELETVGSAADQGLIEPVMQLDRRLENTRKYIRVPFYKGVTISGAGVEFSGYGFEIGRGGIGIRIKDQVSLRSEVEVRFKLEDGHTEIKTRGTVVYLEAVGPETRVGVHFTDVEHYALKAIVSWIAGRVPVLRAAAEIADSQAEPTAPTPKPAAHLVEGENTRQYLRVKLDEPTRLFDAADATRSFEARAVDVSVGGMSVASQSCDLVDGDAVILDFGIGGVALVVHGRVVNRVLNGSSRFGIRFTEVSETAAEAIAAYIHGRLSERGGATLRV